jgi:SAM-dependent methyltransferase
MNALLTFPQAEQPAPDAFEWVRCHSCGSDNTADLVVAEDDLGGRPGRFRFVTCWKCGLSYQNPRLTVESIRGWYDAEYIAHRRKTDWGRLTPVYEHIMSGIDRAKERIVARHVPLGPTTEVLDVGCAVGTFLTHLRRQHRCRVAGVDFKDLSQSPAFDRAIEFHCGLFYEQRLARARFDLVTMWHFLEHDYDPPRTLHTAHACLKREGRLVIEVPRLDSVTWWLWHERWPGLQAPQHTVLYTKETLLRAVRDAGFEVVSYLPWGAFPAYWYLFAGAAFKVLRGRGLDHGRALLPYVAGRVALAPLLLFEKQLNLAMQTVVCRPAR